MKVIASSLRKGNIVDIDGKLYVVMTAENFHPGKGTPTTQVDMRRISDGVKTSQRYKTTDQVERAHVEDHEFSYLYQDGDGFHFMNQETFDQVQVPADIIGDQSIYLQEGMVVNLSVHEGVPVAIELPQRFQTEQRHGRASGDEPDRSEQRLHVMAWPIAQPTLPLASNCDVFFGRQKKHRLDRLGGNGGGD